MKIECYFLLLVILTATVMNCASENIRKSDVGKNGQGKKKHNVMSHSHIINIRSVVHPLPVLRIKSRKKSR